MTLMGLDELADINFQDLVAHAKATAGIKALLVQKEAIGALQIADALRRLGQDMDAGRYSKASHEKS